MLVTTNAIVLSKIKFKDNDLIVTCYTQELGVVGFLLKGVLKSKKSVNKAAYFQLLSQLQLIINYNANRSLQVVKESKPVNVYASLHIHILKSSIVMFLAEVLYSALREEEQNETLYSYIETALLWLDEQSEFANFHLLFLLNLTKYLGFYPDTTSIDFPYFNLADGMFDLKEYDKHSVSGDNLKLLKELLGISFDDLPSVKINGKQRQAFLNMLLQYYELHLDSFRKPKSLEILNQVFS
ncbi:DNA repair protein RecO [Aestuariibaculum suncheonense]|uniref:DNA repair protein RecO n=1 Tax=Aestuariibaculum suncheonense TaxID=1028745 RepID=A0A8J6Q388_9FLAO|nr:DNA repair protein RecO [Aestuariibaculum suncheonense]MBD0833947.1 DNA repair protein RecO [Aestuariibaculum suncheonense]